VLAVVEASACLFAPLTRDEPGRVMVGTRVRFAPVRVADDPGDRRGTVAFTGDATS
jgi:hypothetical protein